MIKKGIKYLLKKIGFKLVRINSLDTNFEIAKSVKTDRLTIHETITGTYYLPQDAVDDIIANAIISNSIFDQDIYQTAKKYLTDGSVVLDIGANFGQMTVLFSNLVGKEGHVYSFEADDFIFNILTKNIEVNNCKNTTAVFGAVHNIDDEKLIFPEQDFERFGTYGSYGIDYSGKNKGRVVDSFTIDKLGIKGKVDFMKIDIQGGDLKAMEGAYNTIMKNRMPIIFEFEYLFQEELQLKFQDYIDFVNKINYKFEKVINGQNYLILPNELSVNLCL
jgi:FkbM family methyltransferase